MQLNVGTGWWGGVFAKSRRYSLDGRQVGYTAIGRGDGVALPGLETRSSTLFTDLTRLHELMQQCTG